MHPARLSLLASKHRQKREIVTCTRNEDGHWHITMACGHEGGCVGHFDARLAKEWNCYECGEAYVKAAPQYATEFEKQ